MDVRIGVTQAPRELSLELDDGDREKTQTAVDGALSGTTDVLTLVDKRGRTVSVPAGKIAYVEIGPVDDRRIGFGA